MDNPILFSVVEAFVTYKKEAKCHHFIYTEESLRKEYGNDVELPTRVGKHTKFRRSEYEVVCFVRLR